MVQNQHLMLRYLKTDEKQLECLLCVVHLLGNFQAQQLYEWWDRNDSYYLYHFIILLNRAVVNLSRINDNLIKDSVVRVISNVFYHFAKWLPNSLDRLRRIPPRKSSPRPPPSPSVPASKKSAIPNPQRDSLRLMMECSTLIRNFMLTSSYQEEETFRTAIFSAVSEFVNSFATTLAEAEPQSFINQHVNINHITHNNNAWQWRKILGTVLVHSKFPFNSLDSNFFRCLNHLIAVYTDEIFDESILSTEQIIHFIHGNNNNNNNNNEKEEKKQNESQNENEDKENNEDNKSSESSSSLSSPSGERISCHYFTTKKLPELIYQLAIGDKGEDFAWTFFLTYLSFTEPLEVSMLIRDFCDYFIEQETPDPMLRLCRCLEYWLLHFFNDFDNRSIAYLLRLLDHLLQQNVAESACSELEGIANDVRVTLTRKLLGLKNVQVPELKVKTPEPILPRHAQPSQLWKPSYNFELAKYAEHPKNPFDFTFNIMEWDSTEIARQLTLIESELFRNIRPHEFFEQAWVSTQREIAAPSITRITRRFNGVNMYLQNLILSEQSKTRRKNLIMKLIEVGEACLSMKNFNTVAQIVSALNSANIDRLRRTWENVDVNRFVNLSQLLVHPFTRLRKEMDEIKKNVGTNAETATVPFLGYYLTELSVLDNKLPNIIDNGINFDKWQRYANILKDIQHMQSVAYSFKTIPFLKWFFTRQIFREIKTEEQLWEISNNLENRSQNSAPDVESVSSILTPRPSTDMVDQLEEYSRHDESDNDNHSSSNQQNDKNENPQPNTNDDTPKENKTIPLSPRSGDDNNGKETVNDTENENDNESQENNEQK